MAKLFSMFIILIAIQAGLILYADQSPLQTVIWEFVTHLSQWGTLGFMLALFGIAVGIGLVGVAAANVFGFKTDFLIFAPAVTGFILSGAIFTNLALVVQNELISRFFIPGCDIAIPLTCNPATFIVALTIGPIALYYVWTIVEWWRGKDY